ncbi:hypothetical protein QBZ16_003680 [Prototheca wickerhamii]|uniref:C3H1-type domain-containing protein n=1 Tax=Prototheca wickerhamii TaxID=3111 RepID=A0AAD9MKX5_PROWI|nr:hypothetical protein QBZ16_003680 [Prototheca wickerhamii]
MADPFGQQGAQGEEGAYDELNAPEYSTDEFRMFHFKASGAACMRTVERCPKRCVHDWRLCPFAHPTENARRRDPRLVRYAPIPCPEYKRGICLRGDACSYAHGVYECWLHPARYRTQLCKEGAACRRPVCFFAHAPGDLRQPTHQFSAGPAPAGAVTSPPGRGAGHGTGPRPAPPAQQQPSAAPEREVAPFVAAPARHRGPCPPESPFVESVPAAQLRSSPVAAGPRKAGGPVGAEAPSTPEPIRAHSCSAASSAYQLAALLSPRGGGAPAGQLPLGGDGSTPRMSNAVARKLGLAPQRACGRRGAGAGANTGAYAAPQQPQQPTQHGFRVGGQPGHRANGQGAPGARSHALDVASSERYPAEATGGSTIPAAYSEGGLAGMHPALLSFMASKQRGPGGVEPASSLIGADLLPAEESQIAGLETVGSVLAGLGGLGLDDEPAAATVFQLSCSATATPQTARDEPARRENEGSPSAIPAKHWGQFPATLAPVAIGPSSWGPTPVAVSAFSTPRGPQGSGSFLNIAFPSSLDVAFLPDQHLNGGAFFQPSPSPRAHQ